MHTENQPTAEMIDQIKDIPIYQQSIRQNFVPILEKPEIAQGFPDNWMTPRLARALTTHAAEFVLSTGTNHARMQIIRPPYFLLNSYYQIWSQHPDIAVTWKQNCQRVSLTTVFATDHVVRINGKRPGADPRSPAGLDERRLDARTSYLNLRLDPALWERSEVERMLEEIAQAQQAHPLGWYHLDCSSTYLAHLARKVSAWGLWDRFPKPASIVHAYEYTPANVRRFLRSQFECPIIELFGSTELGYLYYSDRHGRYLPYLDDMRLELVPVTEGSTTYSLIVSSVRNPFMPLIRYRSGDCVHTVDGSPDPAKIARFCGREKELLQSAGDVVSQADLDDCISDTSAAIFLYQLHLFGAEHVQLQYTTFDGAPLHPQTAAELQRRIGLATGRDCTLSHRAHIGIGKSGKYAWLVRSGDDHAG